MLDKVENIEILSAFLKVSDVQRFFSNRTSHAIIYKVSGKSVYNFQSEDICLSANQLLFIPQGESYVVNRIGDEESLYTVVNFHATIPEAVPCLYNVSDPNDMSNIFQELIKASLFQEAFKKYERLSLFYKILSVMVADKEEPLSKTRTQIEPALSYLEDHIFDASLRVETLHLLCGISNTQFRKLFYAEFGTSPQKHITNTRLMQAKNILESNEYSYIYQVASAVGYEDSLYFSRLFKKVYGYSPSKT